MAQNLPATGNSPAPSRASARTGPQLRIAGLEKACRAIHLRMHSLLPPHPRGGPRADGVAAMVREQALQVKRLLERHAAVPADLTRPSRQAYQWLLYLSSPGRLERHLEVLALLSERSNQAASQKRLPPVQVMLYNTAALYRARQYQDHIEFVVHEAFCESSPAVIEALVQTVFGRRSPARTKLIREFAAGDAFTRLAHSLSAGPAPEGSPRGRCYNLEEVFRRVNADYFQGSLERPRIAWSRRLTARKMGHYQSATDTVVISRTLDDPAVPPGVVDFIMYHELLHKKLGVKVIGKRRYGHTPEFRTAEKQFPRYAEASAFLQALAQNRPPARARTRRTTSRRY